MRELIAVTLAAALLAGCAGDGSRPARSVDEANVRNGAGNTGAAGTAAAGPNANSQSVTEAAREAERR